MAIKTRAEIEAEVERLETITAGDEADIFDGGRAEGAIQGLLWALGDRPEAPFQVIQGD